MRDRVPGTAVERLKQAIDDNPDAYGQGGESFFYCFDGHDVVQKHVYSMTGSGAKWRTMRSKYQDLDQLDIAAASDFDDHGREDDAVYYQEHLEHDAREFTPDTEEQAERYVEDLARIAAGLDALDYSHVSNDFVRECRTAEDGRTRIIDFGGDLTPTDNNVEKNRETMSDYLDGDDLKEAEQHYEEYRERFEPQV